jgi:hypothetical protein
MTTIVFDGFSLMARRLTCLSFGAGTDSGCLLQMYTHDAKFRAEYAPEDFICIFCDTLDEHADTNEYRIEIQQQCKERGIPFFFITGDMGYHSSTWAGGLYNTWNEKLTIGSVAFPATCSPNLKAVPFYHFLADYVRDKYGYTETGKKSLEAFAAERGKIDVLIGFGKGEESRMPDYEPAQTAFDFAKPLDTQPQWRKNAIRLRFPLIDMGMDRQACMDYLKSVNETTPPPSLCFSCMYKGPIEILWSARTDPERFAKWVAAEDRKLRAWADEDFRRARQKPENFRPNSEYKNLGVAGRGEFKNGVFKPVTLLDTLRMAEEKYGHMTAAELDEYRRSHGHCVKTKAA